MNFFLICGVTGFILTLFSMFSGADGDFDHDVSHDGGQMSDTNSISIFSYRTIVVFLTAFGLVGAIVKYYAYDTLTSSVWGVVAGLFMALFAWLIMNFAMKQQANSIVGNRQMVGMKAIVTTSIPKDGLGEVMVELNGQRKYLSAKSKEGGEILNNVQVEILDEIAGVLVVIKQI